MNKKLTFITGVATGFLGVLFFGLIVSFLTVSESKHREPSDNIDNIKFLETEGECFNSSSFEVFEVLDNGNAIARAVDNFSLKVLFLAKKGELYYDHQIINIPNGKCAKQIGVFKFYYETIPVVEIRD